MVEIEEPKILMERKGELWKMMQWNEERFRMEEDFAYSWIGRLSPLYRCCFTPVRKVTFFSFLFQNQT